MKITKKVVALFLAAVTLLTLPVAVLAVTPASVEDMLQFVPVGSVGSANYHYEIAGNTITGAIDLVIPDTYEGYKVTAIRKEAFKDCGYIKSLMIPANVTTVKASAFEGCLDIKSVTFNGTAATLSGSAFKGCAQLETVTLPSALTAIPDSCFENCVALTACAVPAGVTAIGAKAFSNCEKLASIAIGKDLTEIGENAFAACAGVTAYSVDAENPNFMSQSGVLFNKAGTELLAYPGGKSIVDYTVPEGVTSIKKMAFAKNTYLMTVTLASTVTAIEAYAFSQAAALRTVNLNNGLTDIGEMAFQRCGNLKAITLPGSVTDYDSAFFASNIERVTLSEGITTVCSKAFDSCTALTDVTLPDSVTAVELGAFHNCTALTYLEVAPTVTDIDAQAFNGASNLVLGVYFNSPAYAVAVEQNIPYVTLDTGYVEITSSVTELPWESTATFVAGPENAAFVWSSSNPAAVTVDESGKITAVGKGSAVIRASLKENDKIYDEVTVTVTFTFWQKIVYFFRNLFSFLK